MTSDGSMVSFGWKSEGYAVLGVETKLSARLSAGECSNLICGEPDIVIIVNGDVYGWWIQCLQM